MCDTRAAGLRLPGNYDFWDAFGPQLSQMNCYLFTYGVRGIKIGVKWCLFISLEIFEKLLKQRFGFEMVKFETFFRRREILIFFSQTSKCMCV